MALKRKIALVAAVLTLGAGAGAAYAATSGGSTTKAPSTTTKPAPSTQHHCPHMNDAGMGY